MGVQCACTLISWFRWHRGSIIGYNRTWLRGMQERKTRGSRLSVKMFELWYSVVINACVLETPASSKEPALWLQNSGLGRQ